MSQIPQRKRITRIGIPSLLKLRKKIKAVQISLTLKTLLRNIKKYMAIKLNFILKKSKMELLTRQLVQATFLPKKILLITIIVSGYTAKRNA